VIYSDEILLIEDSEAKLASVRSAVERVFPDSSIAVAKSVKSALNCLRGNAFSLVVADMSLPTFDVRSRERGGTARPFGGIEIFDYLKRCQQLTPVIVVSSYPAILDQGTSLTLSDLAKKLQGEYPDNFFGYVFFDSAYLTWEIELSNLLLASKNARRTP
jgi:CheY-like chemotaxis protein